MPYTLPDLPYPESALEPVFSRDWLRGHREWHAGYVDSLSSLLQGTSWDGTGPRELLLRVRELPPDLQEPVREAAGGDLAHTLLWRSLGPDGGGEPNYEFLDDIERDHGSFRQLLASLRRSVVELPGQGWAWLVWNGTNLQVTTTEQEHVPVDRGHTPLLGIDAWDHAYVGAYPDRGSYVDALWNVVDWTAVEERFLQAEEDTRRLHGQP